MASLDNYEIPKRIVGVDAKTNCNIVEPMKKIVHVSHFNIEAAMTEYLRRYRLISDEDVVQLEFGELVQEKKSKDLICPITVTYIQEGVRS